MTDRYDQHLNELMRVHISWLTPAWIKNRDRFDAKVWVDGFKGADIDSILFYSKFHDGYCTWPSAYREVKPERDFVGEITTEASRRDLGVYLYLARANTALDSAGPRKPRSMKELKIVL